MTHSLHVRNILAGTALSALAFAAVMPAQAHPPAGATAAERAALCVRAGLKPPTGADPRPAPAAGASQDEIRAWCAPAEPATGDETVTVVEALHSIGTYLKPKVGTDAPNVESTSRDDLLKSGSPSITDFVRALSETGLNAVGDAAGQNAEGYGIRTLNLRNLGSGRTLILFNGVRLADDPQTNGGPAVTRDPNVTGGGSQNLNGVPMEVMASVDVLKDSGSAAYGGDAVAGAVNFTPRHDLNGFEASFSYWPFPAAGIAPLGLFLKVIGEKQWGRGVSNP